MMSLSLMEKCIKVLKNRLSFNWMRVYIRCWLRNSSIVSVSHFWIFSSSISSPFESNSLMTGSAPLTYLTDKFGNFLLLSPLMNALIWGKWPTFHPQTSNRAEEYFLTESSVESFWQHLRHECRTATNSNFIRSSHRRHDKSDFRKPIWRHSSTERSTADTSRAMNTINELK